MDYESYKRVRKPSAKGIIILNGKVKRNKDKERDEIEQGILEWEKEKKDGKRNYISEST